ncbi:hypothetical protein [Cystobacter fuscus]|uniref:hypothetical protein n=1 Tax=Cystobacter fuscus TaxID=43 RepID=UPI002B31DF73|nr:hypothetical protein F0U63_37680 [Cystobacter fuscus]
MMRQTLAFRRHVQIPLLCLVAVLSNSCQEINGAVTTIQGAIDMIGRESSSWQSTMKELEANLFKDGDDLIAHQVTMLAERGIATGSAELRCDVDFIGNRMIEGLKRIIDEMEGRTPASPVPHFCTVSPTVVELDQVQQGSLVGVNFYGYDLFEKDIRDSNVRVILQNRNGSQQDITFARSFLSHYLMTIRVDDARIDYSGESEKLVITAGEKVLSEISIVSRLPTYFDWCQGDAPPRLAEDVGQTCALSRMSGRFGGATDSVSTLTSNGSWYLSGNSSEAGVCASATCANGYPRAGDFRWSAGTSPVRMVLQEGNACFLTSISGRFQGANDRIEISVGSDGYYYLGGGTQPGASATARCVGKVSHHSEFTWSKGMGKLPLGTATAQVCFLSMVSGHFGGTLDSVRAYIQNGSWYLDGVAEHANLTASVSCISRL